MCVESGGAGSGSWAGGLGPKASRRVQVGAPRGSLLWWHLCPTSSRIPAQMLRGACGRASAPARSHLSGSLGGVDPSPHHPAEKQDLSALHPLTDHQDGQTRCLRWTLQDCPFLGVWGRASCWRPGTLQPGHFLSVPAAPQVALEVPGSLLPRLPHGAEPVRSFVLPLEMFSKEAFVPFPDVGEVWSPGMISSSRKVHPSSHVRVSPCPAMRDPGGVTVPPASAALSYFEPDQVLSTW